MRKINNSNIVMVLIFFTFLLNIPSNSFGQDTTPPELVDFFFIPTVVDVASGVATVTATVQFTDDISGVRTSDVVFRGPSGLQASTSTHSLISGTPNDGVHENLIPIPQFAETGTWIVSAVQLWDETGNNRRYLTDDLVALGLPTELEVVSQVEDTTPPELVDFFFIPTVVDVASGVATVTATVQFTDDISGVRTSDVVFRGPSGLQASTSTHSLISGTPNDGVHENLIPIPQFAETGTWIVSAVQLWDETGNNRRYLTDDLVALGLPTELEVVSAPTIDAILDFFAASVADGTLVGNGPGKSADNRLNAFRNKLLSAQGLINDGNVTKACAQVMSIYKKCDGNDIPPDFVQGESQPILAEMLYQLLMSFGLIHNCNCTIYYQNDFDDGNIEDWTHIPSIENTVLGNWSVEEGALQIDISTGGDAQNLKLNSVVLPSNFIAEFDTRTIFDAGSASLIAAYTHWKHWNYWIGWHYRPNRFIINEFYYGRYIDLYTFIEKTADADPYEWHHIKIIQDGSYCSLYFDNHFIHERNFSFEMTEGNFVLTGCRNGIHQFDNVIIYQLFQPVH